MGEEDLKVADKGVCDNDGEIVGGYVEEVGWLKLLR